LPDATPTSTAPPSPARRNSRWIAAQIAITAIVFWFVAGKLVEQWTRFRGTPTEALHPRWALIALSSVVVFATYAVLIETWRRILTAWGETLSFVDAARIWSLSNLGRYMPGVNQVFTIGAVAELARRRRISPAAAAGSAVINTAVNIATGFVVALAAGWQAVDRLSGGHATLGIVIVVALVTGLLLLPAVLPRLLLLLRRLTGRDLVLGTLPRRAVYHAIVGNVIAWGLYGIAFQCFVCGVLGVWKGSTVGYIAIWAVSYVLGYLAFLVPAGLFVREAAMVDALSLLQLTTGGAAGIVAVSARLWMTILELIPALLFLAHGTRARPEEPTPSNGANP
jgi:hypothetical protein